MSRSVFGFVVLLAAPGCNNASTTPSTSPAVMPTSVATTTNSADSTAKTRARVSPRSLLVTIEPVVRTLSGRASDAPCDFHRLYRGTIGASGLSVYLQKDANALTGSVHYDVDRPAQPIERGQLRGDLEFEFSEKSGGSFRGTCDGTTGALSGTYSRAKKNESFSLWPRPASWPSLHALARSTRVEANDPGCKGRAKPNEAIEIAVGQDDSAICLPTNAKKRKELISEGIGICQADDAGVRLWGFDPRVVADANRALVSIWYDDDATTMKNCRATASSNASTNILFAADGVLTIQESHSIYFGGAHPMNSESGGTTIDLSTGAVVPIEAIVTRPDDLRKWIVTCINPFERVRELQKATTLAVEDDDPPTCSDGSGSLYLWGCEKDSIQSPKWALVEGGIAIFANGNPHVVALFDGMGPILSWQTLLREKLLKPDSPVARLWKDLVPAQAGAPACSSGFAGDRLIKWREAP